MTSIFHVDSLSFDAQGLIPVIAQDAITHEVLMMAWMNKEAIERTLKTRCVTYWSRSRQAFWIKGETSGHTQKLISFRIDCDQDCLLVIVEQKGPACHTRRKTCFYREVTDGEVVEIIKPEDYQKWAPAKMGETGTRDEDSNKRQK